MKYQIVIYNQPWKAIRSQSHADEADGAAGRRLIKNKSVRWTLLHALGQGAAFALLLALVLIALRRFGAQAR